MLHRPLLSKSNSRVKFRTDFRDQRRRVDRQCCRGRCPTHERSPFCVVCSARLSDRFVGRNVRRVWTYGHPSSKNRSLLNVMAVEGVWCEQVSPVYRESTGKVKGKGLLAARPSGCEAFWLRGLLAIPGSEAFGLRGLLAPRPSGCEAFWLRCLVANHSCPGRALEERRTSLR